jgi:hypothetical protein
MIELAEGVGWTRAPVPGARNQKNKWLRGD